LQKRATIILKWFAATVVGLSIVMGAYYVISHQNETAKELSLATTKQPEAFTELYFVDPEAVPNSLTTAAQDIPITFAISNRESRAMDYTYRVSFKDTQHTVTLPDGKVTLQDGQSQSITQTIAVPEGKNRGEVSVQILNKSQAIHLWLERL
jgi:hypothetical protein